MAERRAGTKGRRMGSSRRKQLREGSGEVPAPFPSLDEALAASPSPGEAPAASSIPSEAPAASSIPSESPAASSIPSEAPAASFIPSETPAASSIPSEAPAASSIPSEAPAASSIPSEAPAASSVPSEAPAASSVPSEAPAASSVPSKEHLWASAMVQRVQEIFKEWDKDQEGFVTRSDMQKLQEEDFPCSTEELELVFDGLDTAGTGRLSTEEFTAGLRQFLRSQKAARDHRRRKTASRRVRLVLPSPALEGADSEERRRFTTFMDQLGMGNASDEQEIWELWVKLRQDEPQLLGNLEDFLAEMRHRVQEIRSKKEALEVTLNKRVAEHDEEVQQLCGALEQQIRREQQRLEQESVVRSRQRELDASEREVQRLVRAQMELETQCRSLRSTQQAATAKNQQLEESNRALEDRLQHLHRQLQQTLGHLRTARAAAAQGHAEEPGDRALAELPGEMSLSPQMSPDKSEKRRCEARMGSPSTEPRARSTHHVVWEKLPAEISILGATPRANSTEEDPIPEFRKEERFSAQSSLLREMNDAIAALSKQLKSQALDAPPALAHAARHPQDGAEPQTGLERAPAHGTTPGVLPETFSTHIGHELFEGDLIQGPEVTQAGASAGAGHRRAQELGTEQGQSPEEAQRLLFLQGKGGGGKERMLKAAEHLQGAAGESVEAGEEMEGEGWMQEKMGWEKVKLSGEAEEAALNQGEKLEAGLGPPEAGEAAGRQLGPAAGAGLEEEADPPSELSEKLEIKPGEPLEPEPLAWGGVPRGAAQGDNVFPEVTVAPDPRVLEEERVGAGVQPWGETLGADVLPAPQGGSGGAGMEEGEAGVPQPRGESVGGHTAQGGSAGTEVPVSVPRAEVQDGGAGTDVQPLEAQSGDANVQLLAEGEAGVQLGQSCPGTEQGGSLAPDVQPLEKGDKAERGLGERTGAAGVHGEGPSLAETPARSPDLCGLFPVKAQALELVEAEDAQADVQLLGGASPETPQGGGDCAAVQFEEEAEDEAQGQGEQELPDEPVLDPQGAGAGQGEGAGAGVQPGEEAGILHRVMEQSTDAHVKPLGELDELKLTPGGSMEADLQLSSEARWPGTEQGGSTVPDVQPLDHADKAGEMEAEDAQADVQLFGGASPETPQGKGDGAAVQLEEEAEDGEEGPEEQELPDEPVLDVQGAGAGQGEGAGACVQPREEAGILDVPEEQSRDAHVQLLAEVKELKSAPGGSMETDLQPLKEAGSLGTEQGGRVAPDVQPLDQADKPELGEMEAEDAQADVQLPGSASPETPQGGGDCPAVQLEEEAEDEAQGQGEQELPDEPVLDPQGAGAGQGEGAGAGVQPGEEAGILDRVMDQSTDAHVKPLGEVDELKLTPGGSMEADLQLSSEAGWPGTEQGGSMVPDVQPLDQADKPELGEMEAEDARADVQLFGGASPETPQGKGDGAAVQLEEEAEDGEEGPEEQELPDEPVLDPQGAGAGQGEGAGACVQPGEEAGILDAPEAQSTDASVQVLPEAEELKPPSGGSTEADGPPLGAAGMWGGEQRCPDMWEGAAGVRVSPPPASCPERAAAAKGPGLEAKLGVLPGPDGQIPEDIQTLEIAQGERDAAEGKPLDGAQGLEVMQGERLEAGARSLVKIQGVGIKQNHDAGASALAPPVSEVPFQISTLELETLMQEDVLVPDVRQLGASGQAAQSQLQEQVSAQGDEGRLHAASRQLEEKLLHVMETEQLAAGSAKPPRQEMPPTSALRTGAQQEEDAGNDQLGMDLGDGSLGDAANSKVQPQRQLSGERREDLDAGRWEKKQEVGGEASQQGELRPGEAGAVTAGGAGAAPRGSPGASPDPDHLYNVLFVGDSHVGKTSFLYRLHADTFNPHLTATVGLDYQIKNLVVDNKRFALRLWDSAGQERYHSITKQFFRKADGVVLMYDITSEYSFSDVRYWLSCIQEGAEDGVAILLLGNKTDCAAARQVPAAEGERLAKEHQLMFYECSAASGHNVCESMVSFIRLLKDREDESKKKAEEVPEAPQKKKGCCW